VGLIEDAAQIGPEIDRLVIGVHREMRRRRSEVDVVLAEAGVPSIALFIDLRPFLIHGPVSVAVAHEFSRFVPSHLFARTMDRLHAASSFRPVGDMLVPSPEAVSCAVALTAIQAQVVAEMWGSGRDTMRTVLRVAGSMVAAALDMEGTLPLFGPLARLGDPAGADVYVLHHRLTALRYLRSDIHVRALRSAGLDLPVAQVVDAAWRGVEIAQWLEGHLPGAHSAGWLRTVDAPVLTEAGRRRRQEIEDATNIDVAAVLARVPAGQLRAFVTSLPKLPG
jgi:hypothetical protein